MYLKKIVKSSVFKHSFGWLASIYIKLVYKTGSWQIIMPPLTSDRPNFEQQAIFAFWHGRLLMMPYLKANNRQMNVIISSHSDGEIIKNAMQYFKIDAISGSSQKKSTFVLRQILKKLKLFENISITPDGSRGPNRQINSNIIDIAKIAKVPIIPMSFSAKKCYSFNSWDRFMLAFPFSEGVFIYGKPITVPANADQLEISRLKQILANELNAITLKADNIMGIKQDLRK